MLTMDYLILNRIKYKKKQKNRFFENIPFNYTKLKIVSEINIKIEKY